jgi:ribosomal protein L37E
MKYTASKGRYYDLILVPHGHIPVSKIKVWRSFPLLCKEQRTESYFHCPTCGGPSFFKIKGSCEECSFWGNKEVSWKQVRSKERQDYFRRLCKDIEALALPLLAFFGKAWYVRSERLHYSDPERRVQEEAFWAEVNRRRQDWNELNNDEENQYWEYMNLCFTSEKKESVKQ